jgi:hypothetical protein
VAKTNFDITPNVNREEARPGLRQLEEVESNLRQWKLKR